MTIEHSLIYPSNKYKGLVTLPPKEIKFHEFDLLLPSIEIHNHRFYKASTIEFSKIIENLKQTLSECLELYLPVSGSFNEHSIEPYNTIGIPFITHVKNEVFTGEDTEEYSPRTDVALDFTKSLFAVKITKFKCGTICIATNFHHQVGDFRTFLDFFETWASLSRGEPVDFNKIPTDWTRTPSKYFQGYKNDSTPVPPFVISDEANAEGLAYLLYPTSEYSNWRFTKESVDQLKKDYSPVDGEGWISTSDALTALTCGVITRAREKSRIPRYDCRSSVESGIEKVLMAADGRERAPGKNMNNGKYFGNFNNLWSVDINRNDLLSTDINAGKRVSSTIRKGITQLLTPQAISNRISFLENEENRKNGISWGADIMLTNWCIFDLQGPKFDFGFSGGPFLITNGDKSVLPRGFSQMMQPNKITGDYIVFMTIERDGGAALRSDPVLNKYATLMNYAVCVDFDAKL